MKRQVIAVLVCLLAAPHLALADGPAPNDCAIRNVNGCPAAPVTADQQQGDFHGLIMVPGQPSVLNTAAHSGTKAGCGDCTWELILACLRNDPSHPENQESCASAVNSPQCGRGQLSFRLYLTTEAVRNQLVDMVCLGNIKDVVPVGDRAALDVQQYLKDVKPPDLALHVAPPKGIPAGLPAYFWVRPPADLTPTPFGNGQITETITIAPQRYDWTWGDGQVSGWTTDAGGPYPTGTLTHTYAKADHYSGHVVTEWGATYTITVAGQTFGPYDATGTLTRTQLFTTTVLRARSTLVSHG